MKTVFVNLTDKNYEILQVAMNEMEIDDFFNRLMEFAIVMGGMIEMMEEIEDFVFENKEKIIQDSIAEWVRVKRN